MGGDIKHMIPVPAEIRRGIGYPGAGGSRGCETPEVDPRKPTQVLWKNSKRS